MRHDSSIILHDRCLPLSKRQAKLLTLLLTCQGQAVPETDLQHTQNAENPDAVTSAILARTISRIRERVRPHGYDICRVIGYGFILVLIGNEGGKGGGSEQ